MDTTPVSLLEQLRQSPASEATSRAWEKFVRLCTPLLYHWARRLGLPEHEAADLVQDVFTVLVVQMPGFKLDPARSFRGWLWTVTLNKWRDRRRRRTERQAPEGTLEQVADREDPCALDEAEYRACIVGRALRLMQAEFAPATWKACWEHVVGGQPAAQVAAELGITAGSVYVAKSRVLFRLRQELAGLVD
jgi:RNA polymerase sigma-70 factor (ECF subfamily)